MTSIGAAEAAPQRTRTSDVLLDGLFAGMIGALAVALWFLVLDVAAGRPLYTPALLGNVVLAGPGSAAHDVVIAPVPIAAYTAVHFLIFVAFGVGLSYLMSLFDVFPIMFFVLLVLFLCFQVGFFAMDRAFGAELLGKLHPWSVVVANLLAAGGMALYLWKRHPGAIGRIEQLWKDED